MIVVAGHVCLDIIPAFTGEAALDPGKLVEVGPVSFATGGAVANVGLTLTRLGLTPTLLGRIGDDPFGAILERLLAASGSAEEGGQATAGIGAVKGETTSYSIVINPPGRDRTFLHHPGCNDSFTAADLDPDRWARADLLYFGYPPLMRGVYEDGGESLAEALSRFRSAGVTTALDMAMPDANGLSGSVDWRSFLSRILPHVDLFLPSWQEISFMLEPARPALPPTRQRLFDVGRWLLSQGAAVVGLKLGEEGIYLRTGSSARLSECGRNPPPADWAEREILSPNFSVVARGTTGAGDATIAGLLAALAKRLPLERAATMASAVGACSVEGIDAVSGVRSWHDTEERVESGWSRAGGLVADETGWTALPETGLFLGPSDRGGMR